MALLVRTEAPPLAIRLRDALLCLDCETVSPCLLRGPCPQCGSVERFPLSAWLNRKDRG